MFFCKHTSWPHPIRFGFSCRWLARELIGVFHDMLAFFKECIPISIHSLLLDFDGIRFNYGANLLFCESRVGGKNSLLVIGFIACKCNMLFYFLWRTINFMITYLFLVPTSNYLVECDLAPPMVFYHSLNCEVAFLGLRHNYIVCAYKSNPRIQKV